MKYLQVDCISLQSKNSGTQWFFSDFLFDQKDENTRVCVLECSSHDEANDIVKSMEFESENYYNYYLANSNAMVIATRALLEEVFAGQLEQNQISDIVYDVNPYVPSVRKFKVKLTPSTFLSFFQGKPQQNYISPPPVTTDPSTSDEAWFQNLIVRGTDSNKTYVHVEFRGMVSDFEIVDSIEKEPTSDFEIIDLTEEEKPAEVKKYKRG